jgi:uncharacterized membrane protein YbhN (UPF0104 family)
MSKRASYYLRLLISLALLAFILTRVDPKGLIHVLSTAEPAKLCLGLFLIIVAGPLLGSIKVMVLLRGQEHTISLSRMLSIDLTSRFYGLLAPSGLGHGAVRWYRLGSEIEDRAAATVCVVFNRLSQTLTVVGIGSLCWMAAHDKPELNASIFAYGLAGLGLLYGVLLTRPFRELAKKLCLRLLPDKAAELVLRLPNSVEKMARAGFFIHFLLFLVSAARQFALISGGFCLALALGAPVSFFDLGWVSAVGFLAGHLPVSVAEVGIRELTYLTLLESLGVEPHIALALPLMLSTSALTVAGFGGLIELFQVKRAHVEDRPSKRS